MSDLPEQYAYDRSSGLRLQTGDTLIGSRGERWTYQGVSRPAYGHSSGRVSVSRPCPDLRSDGTCPHMWDRGGIERREFFPHVFGLYLGNEEGSEA